MKAFKARQTYLFVILLLGVFLITGCGGGGGGSGSGSVPVIPAVTLRVPLNNVAVVAINMKIAATFTEAMDPATINTTTFIITQGASAVLGTVGYSGVTAVFAPASPLAAGATYTATITTGAKNLAGNALARDYVWSFTAGAQDTTKPTVTLTVPLNNAAAVAINTKISATFTEAMNPLTITTTTFTLKQGATVVPGNVTYSGVTAVFTPLSPLAASTPYTATITAGATDLAGNALASDFVWSFTTGAALATTKPAVTLTVPANAAKGVLTNAKIAAAAIISVDINIKTAATFTTAMDPLTITTTTFTLMQGATVVPGIVTYSGVTAVFTPLSPLTPGTTYTATITTGAKDLAGNALASDYVWSFTTGAAPDTTAPTVILTVPANAATGVPIGNILTATFSEAMDPLTITNLTFTLTQGATPVSGTVIYFGATAVLTPLSPLAAGTTYTATVTTGATDLAGNALVSGAVWTFITGAAPDTTAPIVTLTVPADAATGVAINKTIAVTFSEAMDPLTITIANFTVAGVTGTVTYNAISDIATFTPLSNLATSTTYTATITTGVKDLAGNALAGNKVWTFSTGTGLAPGAVALGAAAPFGVFGGAAGMTNQGILTVINGDIGTTGASTLNTGFHDSVGDVYTETPLNIGTVNGRIYTAAPPPGGAGVGGNAATFAIATAAARDALIAYNSMSPASLPGGVDPGAGQLGGLTLAPGIYKPAGATFLLTGSDLTLDGQGDPNAVWVFQTPAGLTIGAPALPRSIILTNGAQAKNVFWYVGSAARIENRCNIVGTIIASAGVTISTAGELSTTTLQGRALGLNASVTMVNTLINVPAP